MRSDGVPVATSSPISTLCGAAVLTVSVANGPSTTGLNAAVLRGCALTMIPKFAAGKAIEVIGRDLVTIFQGVPTMYATILNDPATVAAHTGSLRVCVSGGSALPEEGPDHPRRAERLPEGGRGDPVQPPRCAGGGRRRHRGRADGRGNGAAVALRPGADTVPAGLQAYVKERIAGYKYPRRVRSLDELPKGPTGKILRREVHPPAEL